ncbi:hypothetical protein WNY51_18155 [Pseudocolwellia sp. AS88]|uniref:hypothetical protein n=1 Tax=Pseudocolwellia sp. AS88 TaxID=3063958 RepID=UPI0026F0BD68|nr:hypothetical protein [Pseudocolwellia sp. AS88]MDO7085522.1 hypothetical protein [Pseudocolwellia sp. AS88]
MSTGPVIVVSLELINNEVFESLLKNMLEDKHILKSEKEIINTILFSAAYEYEFKNETNAYVRYFTVLDGLAKTDHPDKPGKLFKLSKASRYNKLNHFKELGFFKELTQAEYPKEVSNSKKGTSIFQLQKPTKLISLSGDASNVITVNTTGYRDQLIKEKALLNSSTSILYVTNKEINSVATHVLVSAFLSRAGRPDKSFKEKTLTTSFRVPSTIPNEEYAEIKITATSLATTEIISADQMLLVDYTLSQIKQYVQEEQYKLKAPIKNAFTLDLVDIIRDFDKSDSGGYRAALYADFQAISGTEFDISASEGAKGLMAQFGFTDEDGNVFDVKKVSLLKIDGERLDADEDLLNLSKNRKVPRHITVKLPDFMLEVINNFLNGLSDNILPMFNRNTDQLTVDDAGYCWVLNNYIMSMLPKVNFIHGPIDVDRFLTNFMPAVKQLKSSILVRNRLFTILNNSSRVLYREDFKSNVRRQISFSLFISQIEKFIIMIRNKTTVATKLSSQVYTISIIRSDKDLNDLVQAQRHALSSSDDYLQNETFKEGVLNAFEVNTKGLVFDK